MIKLFLSFAADFVHLHIENVIKKGGETRLCEALATLRKRRRCYILFAAAKQITNLYPCLFWWHFHFIKNIRMENPLHTPTCKFLPDWLRLFRNSFSHALTRYAVHFCESYRFKYRLLPVVMYGRIAGNGNILAVRLSKIRTL